MCLLSFLTKRKSKGGFTLASTGDNARGGGRGPGGDTGHGANKSSHGERRGWVLRRGCRSKNGDVNEMNARQVRSSFPKALFGPVPLFPGEREWASAPCKGVHGERQGDSNVNKKSR